jgi:dinuclear metal center YbgI/SA1388 family protein
VLLEPPSMPCISKASRHVVLLTTDLTSAVTSEALALPASVIITYHPIIFRPLKSLTLSDTQQVSLLRLAQAGISVYSPHTAVDAATGGVNDWLADGITGGAEAEVRRHCIQASALPPEGFENAGMGRVVELKAPQDLPTLVNRVKAHLGMERVMVVDGGRLVKTIGLCAGGGGKLLQQLKDVDLLYTGELSHHEALSARERGISVITCEWLFLFFVKNIIQ